MPLYEYRCEKCGQLFEVRQKFADEPLRTHENCGGDVHRLLSAPALQFKGSGWYVNDYGKGGKTSDSGSSGKGDSSAKKDSASPASGGEKSSTTSTPEKSSTTPETKPSS